MKGFLHEDYTLCGNMPPAAAKQRWDEEIEKQKELRSDKLRGNVFHKLGKEGRFLTLKYYHCYGKDFCDTVYKGEIMEYESGCQLAGRIEKPKTMITFAWVWELVGFLACCAGFLLQFLWRSEIDWLICVFCFIGVTAVAVLTLRIEKYRVDAIVNHLQTLINDPAYPPLDLPEENEEQDSDDREEEQDVEGD